MRNNDIGCDVHFMCVFLLESTLLFFVYDHFFVDVVVVFFYKMFGMDITQFGIWHAYKVSYTWILSENRSVGDLYFRISQF